MNMPPEMAELMQKTVEEHFAAYWQREATPEQEEKRKAEGKTFRGAAHFVRTVAEKHRKGRNCVAMPDALAYWLLMEYMENGTEGGEYKTPEEIEAEARQEEERAARIEAEKKAAAEKAAKAKAKAEAKAAAEAAKAERAKVRAEAEAKKAKAREIAAKVEAAQMTLALF